MLFTQAENFFFSKAYIFSVYAGLDHRVFFEIGYSRLRSVFLDGKNSGHIGCCDSLRRKITVLKPTAQHIQISFLCSLVILGFTDHGIPFVYDEQKWPSFRCLSISQYTITETVSLFVQETIVN